MFGVYSWRIGEERYGRRARAVHDVGFLAYARCTPTVHVTNRAANVHEQCVAEIMRCTGCVHKAYPTINAYRTLQVPQISESVRLLFSAGVYLVYFCV